MSNRPKHVGLEDGALRRAKALSAPTRVEILTLLRSAPSPLTAGALAGALGIHHTAVRQHLAVLADAGLVRSQALPVEGRGRPRTGYTATATEGVPYRELAGMLADAVRTGRTARDAGRDAGLLVEPSADGPIATLHDEAQRLGFEPRTRRRGDLQEIVLGACPFAELATTQPETVCELHVGLAEGIAARAGGLEVEGIHLADPHKGGCRIVVRRTAT
jgi:predicted ArsR family transcriptional regulator